MLINRHMGQECEMDTTNATRRSFLCTTGAALPVVLASAVAGGREPAPDDGGSLTEQVERLSTRLALLEDTNAIRELHHAYGRHLDRGSHEEIVNLFAEDAEVTFNGGRFVGRDKGIRRLYVDRLGQGVAADRSGPVHGFLLDQTQEQDRIEVAPDRRSARARFHCLIHAGARLESRCSMMEMARLQGQGTAQWWEGGVYENAYVRDGGAWTIWRLDYRPIWQADYALGWSHARPGDVAPFSTTYPEDPAGPDALLAESDRHRPDMDVATFRYPHPVTRTLWET
jgi:hypothetical protein